MKVYFLLLVLLAAIECKSAKFTARQVLSNRLQKYAYFSTNPVEAVIAKVNRTDVNQINEPLHFDLPDYVQPHAIEDDAVVPAR